MSSLPHDDASRVQDVAPARIIDEPVSVLATLVGAITNPDRYSVVFRDGELFIRPRAGASRLIR
jgi:hypothetical protein